MILIIKLTPKSAQNAITGWMRDANGDWLLKASVTAVPENGKANAALIKLLSKTLKLPKSSLTIISGETSRLKKIALEDVDASAMMRRLPKQDK